MYALVTFCLSNSTILTILGRVFCAKHSRRHSERCIEDSDLFVYLAKRMLGHKASLDPSLLDLLRYIFLDYTDPQQ